MPASDQSSIVILAPVDWVVVFLYAVAVFWIAWWAMKQIKDTGGLLLGKRKMGPVMMMAASFAGGTNANHPMSVASATFEKGMSGVWISLTWMIITPFFWVFPPALRRLRIVTLIDVVQLRFGKSMSMLFKLVSLITVPMAMGLGIKSAAIVIEVMTGGAISGFWAEIAIAVPTLVYALMGGVIAAYMTDVFQGILIIVLSFLLIPFAIYHAGGVAPLDAAISDELTSLWNTEQGAFGVWWIVWFAIGVTFSAVISSGDGAAAAKNETASRMKIFGLVAKRFCTVGWGLVGLLAIGLFAGHPMVLENTDNVFPVASGELLPPVLRGLMVACILASVMSSLDASILKYAGMLVRNVYQEHFVKSASAKHYLVATRFFAAFGMACGWWVASGIESVVQFTKYVEPVNGLVGVTILVALMWRRVTARGAIAGVIVMGVMFFYAARTEYPNGLEDMPGWLGAVVGSMSSFYAWTGFDTTIIANNKLDVPYMYPLYLVPGLLTIAVVSLFTRQHNDRSVEEFYARLDTPVGEEHKLREAGYGADDLEGLDNEQIDGVVTMSGQHRLLIVDLLYLPGLIRRGTVKLSEYRWDLWGTVLSIIFVVTFLFFLDWGIQALF